MAFGYAYLSVKINGRRSLKERRGIVKSLISRSRQQFNVSIADLDIQPRSQSAMIGVSAVANRSYYARGVIDRLVEFLDRELIGIGEIVDLHIEIED